MGLKSSPRSWGCFLIPIYFCQGSSVFPTLVGVFLCRRYLVVQRCESSPRSWGCFSVSRANSSIIGVFPTLVGVFLSLLSGQEFRSRSSPRSWGCFYYISNGCSDFEVFPTLVGVFPPPPCARDFNEGLPHARGGVSTTVVIAFSSLGSSPRSWGCFYNRLPQEC